VDVMGLEAGRPQSNCARVRAHWSTGARRMAFFIQGDVRMELIVPVA
jgi:hypothetical protein